MSIVIHGLDMPKTYLRNVIIAPDGKIVYEDEEGITYGLWKGTAMQLPDDKVVCARLQVISEKVEGDEEEFHREADNVLCELLESLGYKETVAYFKKHPKWYS